MVKEARDRSTAPPCTVNSYKTEEHALALVFSWLPVFVQYRFSCVAGRGRRIEGFGVQVISSLVLVEGQCPGRDHYVMEVKQVAEKGVPVCRLWIPQQQADDPRRRITIYGIHLTRTEKSIFWYPLANLLRRALNEVPQGKVGKKIFQHSWREEAQKKHLQSGEGLESHRTAKRNATGNCKVKCNIPQIIGK